MPNTLTAVLTSALAAPQVIQAATVYRPRIGRRSRGFMSASDAVAYEDGYMAYPAGRIQEPNTPASSGWFDAEAEELDRQADQRRSCDD